MSACLAPTLRGQAFPLNWQGRVHSVFDHAVNIAASDVVPNVWSGTLSRPLLLTLLDSPHNMGERCLVVPALAPSCSARLPVGTYVQAEQGRLTARGLALEFSACPVWKTELVARRLASSSPLPLIRLPLSSVIDVCRVAGLTPHPAPWGKALYQRMAMWVLEQDIEAQCEGLTDLLGAGPGLTPAGDDMLIGWLCGRQIVRDGSEQGHDRELRDAAIQRELATLLYQYPLITTDISRAFLEDALHGRFCLPVARLGRIAHAVASLADADSAFQLSALRRAVDVAARFGASSGRDGAFGLLLALASDFFQ